MVADAKMIPLGLDIRVHYLAVFEKLRGLRLARNAPFVEVQQPAKEPKLSLLAENFDLHEVHKLPGERLDALLQSRKVGFNLRPQQSLHAVVGELRP